MSDRGSSNEIIAEAVAIRQEGQLLAPEQLADREQLANLRIAFGETEKERRDGLIMLELITHIKATKFEAIRVYPGGREELRMTTAENILSVDDAIVELRRRAVYVRVRDLVELKRRWQP